MIRRVLLAAILAGFAAGLVMGVIQHVRLTPLILEAETFEKSQQAHDHGAAATTTATAETAPVAAQPHDAEEWAPADGLERTIYTSTTSIIAAIGFALLLAGLSIITNLKITRANGWIWGLCGFAAVSFAPATGLAPELPGMPAADLMARQIWWLGTIICTAAALWIFATQTTLQWRGAAVMGLLLPHIAGAPKLAGGAESDVPAHLAASFVSNSLAANLVMWLLIGIFLAYTLSKFESDVVT